MERKYAVAEPCFINYKGINLLTGTEEEGEEITLKCYDGETEPFEGIYKGVKGTYKLTYPKYSTLTEDDLSLCEKYVGYFPEDGEYNALAITFGVPERI